MAKEPIYAQIKRWILGQIEMGVFPEGSLLTPEQELAGRFGVSRPTVRQAILELVQEGVLARARGRGTTVLPRRLSYPVGRLLSFTEEFASSGARPTSDVLECHVTSAPRAFAERLGEPVGAPIFVLTRVRRLEGEPVAWQRSSLSARFVPGIESLDFREASLYQTLSERYGLAIDHAEEVVRAGVAERGEAKLLAIAAGDPVYRIERRSYATPPQPIEIVDSIYRADRYEIRLLLRR